MPDKKKGVVPAKKKRSVTPKKKIVRKKRTVSSSRVRKDDSATLKRLRKQYPNNEVVPIRNSSKYRVIGKGGTGSVTLTPGKKVKKK